MLWPDLAGGFPWAPDRSRETIEDPLVRLHDFRNRLAHHQRIWNHDLEARAADIVKLASYLDPALPEWIMRTGALGRTLEQMPWRGVAAIRSTTGVSGSAIS